MKSSGKNFIDKDKSRTGGREQQQLTKQMSSVQQRKSQQSDQMPILQAPTSQRRRSEHSLTRKVPNEMSSAQQQQVSHLLSSRRLSQIPDPPLNTSRQNSIQSSTSPDRVTRIRARPPAPFARNSSSVWGNFEAAEAAAGRRISLMEWITDANRPSIDVPPRIAPTFRLQPKKVFDEAEATSILVEIVDSHMKKFAENYTAESAGYLSKCLCNVLREEMKRLNYDRYRFVVTATIGQKTPPPGITMAARPLWHHEFDKMATYSTQNRNVFCCATVFAVYKE